MTFHLACVHIIFSSVSVAEWPPFGKWLLTRLIICSLCILTICILNRKRNLTILCLVLSRNVQILELKANAYFKSKTLKSIFEENLFIKYRM